MQKYKRREVQEALKRSEENQERAQNPRTTPKKKGYVGIKGDGPRNMKMKH